MALNSLMLSGSSDYLEVPNSSSINITGAFTAEAWIKLNNSTGVYQSIFERYGWPDGNGNNGGFYFRVTPSGKMEFVVNQSIQSGYGVSGNTLVTSGVWHHLAAVADGTQMRMYIDGTLDASVNIGALPSTGTTNLFVASGNWSGGRINGKIDEVRLTAAALYNSNFTPATILTAGANTRGLWKFDSAIPPDFSGSGNTGIVRGSPALSTDLPTLGRNSIAVNGTSDYLEVPNSSSINITGAFTAEAWIKLNNSAGIYQSVFERYGQPDANGNNGGFYFRITPSGKMEFVVTQSIQFGWAASGNSVLSSGVWHHVAAVDDGTQLRIYIDGVLDGSLSISYYAATGTTNLFVGSGNWGGGRINGKIDEVRLTAAALYNANFTPATKLMSGANTRGLWKFDGVIDQDSSGNSNLGLVRGSPLLSSDTP